MCNAITETGITLLEVLVTLAIVSILISLSAVGPEFVRNENVTRVSRELAGDIRRIRQDAMTSGGAANSRGFGIRFENSMSYTLFEFNDTDGDSRYSDTGEEATTTQRNLASSIVMSIKGVTPNNNVLIYDKLGIPRDSDWLLEQMTIVVKHESSSPVKQKCIVVSTSRVREGLWDGSNCKEQ